MSSNGKKPDTGTFRPLHLSALRDGYLNPKALDGIVAILFIDNTGNSGPTAEMMEALPDDVQRKARYFKSEPAQKQFLITQSLIRILLGSFLRKEPKEINIARHSRGKPYAAETGAPCFNVSNSATAHLFGLSLGAEIGVDIEAIRPVDGLDDLIERNFMLNEISWINAIPKMRLQRFMRFWTIKEAFLKAIGEGMRLTPDNVCFDVHADSFKLGAVNGVFEQQEWQVVNLFPDANYESTIVYSGCARKLNCYRLLP